MNIDPIVVQHIADSVTPYSLGRMAQRMRQTADMMRRHGANVNTGEMVAAIEPIVDTVVQLHCQPDFTHLNVEQRRPLTRAVARVIVERSADAWNVIR